MSFINVTQNNTRFLTGHDFAADLEKALLGALRDVAQFGMGQVDNAFHESELRARYAWPYKNEHKGDDYKVADLGQDVTSLTDHISGFTADPSLVTVSGLVRFRNGEEGWHTDGTFDRNPVSKLHGSGLRMLMKLNGDSSRVITVAKNEQMVKLHPGTEDAYPKDDAHFVCARYLTGSLILMPQSVDSPLMTTTDSGLTKIESPYHTGMQDPGFCMAARSGISILHRNLLTRKFHGR